MSCFIVSFWICVSFWVIGFSGHRPSNEIFGSYGNFSPSFLRNIHSDSVNLHSHQRIQFSSHLLQHLLFIDFLMMAIMISIRSYPIKVLMCISLLMSDTEYLSMCLLAIYRSSIEKCLFRSSAHILINCVIF